MWDDLRDLAHHFAQWGAEHLADTNKTWPKDLEEAARKTYPNKEGDLCPLHSVLQRAAFIAGAKWDREHVMKEAVEGEVMDFCFVREVNYSRAAIEFVKIPRLQEGDKVIVIVKKED